MRIVVPMKAVPDLVEEIELNEDETGIDAEYLTFVLGEWDSQALEEALLLKDAIGAEVVAVGLAGGPRDRPDPLHGAGQGCRRGRQSSPTPAEPCRPDGPGSRSWTGPPCWQGISRPSLLIW